MTEIYEHYEQNLLEVERTRLAAQCQKLYNDNVRPHAPGRRFFSKKMIATHFEEHAPTPAIIRAIEFRTHNFTLNALRKNELFKRNPKGRVKVEQSTYRLYMQVSKERKDLMGHLFMGKSK